MGGKHRQLKSLTVVQKLFPRVTSVRDATTGVRVQVTNADTRTAKQKDHTGCVMANACRRAMPIDGIIMSISSAYLIHGTVAVRYHVPSAVQREIVCFDRGGKFALGEYRLRPPTTKLGQLHSQKESHKGNPNTRRLRHRTAGIRAVL